MKSVVDSFHNSSSSRVPRSFLSTMARAIFCFSFLAASSPASNITAHSGDPGRVGQPGLPLEELSGGWIAPLCVFSVVGWAEMGHGFSTSTCQRQLNWGTPSFSQWCSRVLRHSGVNPVSHSWRSFSSA